MILIPLLMLLQDAPAPTVSVMSFNIRYGTAQDGENSWPARRDQLIGLIQRHDPDILGVQEALDFQLQEIQAALPGYAFVGVGRDDGATRGEYSAIFYRSSRYTPLDQGTFWLSDTPEVPGSMTWGNRITRICTWARFRDARLGRSFYVYNLHLDHESEPSRQRSAELIAQRVNGRSSPDPVIVMGDFNTGEDQPALTRVRSAARLNDTFRDRNPGASNVGTYHAFTGDSTGAKIDHILTSSQWRVLSAEIDRSSTNGRYPSDHFPVLARIGLGTP